MQAQKGEYVVSSRLGPKQERLRSWFALISHLYFSEAASPTHVSVSLSGWVVRCTYGVVPVRTH